MAFLPLHLPLFGIIIRAANAFAILLRFAFRPAGAARWGTGRRRHGRASGVWKRRWAQRAGGHAYAICCWISTGGPGVGITPGSIYSLIAAPGPSAYHRLRRASFGPGRAFIRYSGVWARLSLRALCRCPHLPPIIQAFIGQFPGQQLIGGLYCWEYVGKK